MLRLLVGGSDSYFEYLIKYARLTNTNDHIFADTWNTAVDTSSRVLRQVRLATSVNIQSVQLTLQ